MSFWGLRFVTLSAESSLILRENKSGFRREGILVKIESDLTVPLQHVLRLWHAI